MWSAIPIALLCMVVNQNERKQLPSISPPQALSGLKSVLSGLKSTLSGLKSALSGLESERADLRPERA